MNNAEITQIVTHYLAVNSEKLNPNTGRIKILNEDIIEISGRFKV